LWLALATAATAAGMVIPSDLIIFTPSAAYTAAAGLFLAAAALRFPRAAGIPTLVLLFIAAAGSALLVRTWTPVRDTRVLAELVVLALEEDRMRIEVEIEPEAPLGPEVAVVELPTSELIVRAVMHEPSRYLFFLGASRFIQLDEPIASPPPGPPGWLREIDLISSHRTETRTVRVNLLQRYELRARPHPNEPILLVRTR